jgi:hypothetical protein
MPRVLHARWILPFVVAAAAFALWQNGRSPHWRTLRPGVEFMTMPGEPYCRRGSAVVAVLRVDAKRARLHANHFSRTHPERPLSILEWQKTTGALAVFNAGQYYPDWGYMGLLVCDGDTVSALLHAGFRAMLVASDHEAHVIDLEGKEDAVSGAWSDMAQSFMLFDHEGGLRVRRSGRIAPRTVVAEDGHGRIVVCVSEGAYTLADFGTLLMRSELGLTQAMSMDGGIESELVIDTPSFRYASFGEWPRGHEPVASGARAPLPAVISVDAP